MEKPMVLPVVATAYLGIALAQVRGQLRGYFHRVADKGELIQVAEHYRRCPGRAPKEVTNEIIREILRRRRVPQAATPGQSRFQRLKAIDLVALAEHYTDLQPAGPGKLKGCCPLHQERTPSFYVYTDERRWRCFGACASGGDVIDLLKGLALQSRRTTC